MNKKRITLKLKEQIKNRDGNLCVKCLRENKLQTHHKQAVADGGDHDESNLITLCSFCHREWHHFESIYTMNGRGLDEWLSYPPGYQIYVLMEIAKEKNNDMTLIEFIEFIQKVWGTLREQFRKMDKENREEEMEDFGSQVLAPWFTVDGLDG